MAIVSKVFMRIRFHLGRFFRVIAKQLPRGNAPSPTLAGRNQSGETPREATAAESEGDAAWRAARPNLASGWNGLRWGATQAEFRRRFPRAWKTDAGWWRTGLGHERFLGFSLLTQYCLSEQEGMNMVVFYPTDEQRDRISVAAINQLGAPPGGALEWRFGDARVQVKAHGLAVVLTYDPHSSRAERAARAFVSRTLDEAATNAT